MCLLYSYLPSSSPLLSKVYYLYSIAIPATKLQIHTTTSISRFDLAHSANIPTKVFKNVNATTAGEITQNGSTYYIQNTILLYWDELCVVKKNSAIYKFGILDRLQYTTFLFLFVQTTPKTFFCTMRNIWNRDIYRNSRRTQSPPAIHNPKTKWALYTGLQVYEAIILIIWPYPHVALTSPLPSSDWKKPYVAHQTVTVKMNTLCSKIWKMCNVFSLTEKKKTLEVVMWLVVLSFLYIHIC